MKGKRVSKQLIQSVANSIETIIVS